MTPSLISLWMRAMDISVGAPEVIYRRLTLMQPHSLWSPETLLEVQHMVMEKSLAAFESGWALYRAGLMLASGPALGSTQWWSAPHQRRMSNHAVRTATQALRPLSRRVNANVKRLRAG